jgi:hypothetical protein
MPIAFGTDFLDNLNRTSGRGKLIKAVQVTESPGTIKYWADHEDSFVFEGHTYVPLAMFWQGIKNSVGMPAEGATVGLSNIGNKVIKYVKDVDITGNPVVLQLLPFDLLLMSSAPLTSYWKRRFNLLSVKADVNAAVFSCGRDLGKNRLPRRLIFPEESL